MEALHHLFSSKILTPSDWEKFREEFEKQHPRFYSKLHQVSPALSPGEVRLVTMLKLNYGTKKTSEILCVHPKSIIKSRYRLKKKLVLGAKCSLEEWAASI